MRSKWMRYSSSSAARSPCWARSTSRRTLSIDSRGFFSGASELTVFRPTPLARRESEAARTAETPEVRHPGHNHVEQTVLGRERDDTWTVLVERPLQLIGRCPLDERV